MLNILLPLLLLNYYCYYYHYCYYYYYNYYYSHRPGRPGSRATGLFVWKTHSHDDNNATTTTTNNNNNNNTNNENNNSSSNSSSNITHNNNNDDDTKAAWSAWLQGQGLRQLVRCDPETGASLSLSLSLSPSPSLYISLPLPLPLPLPRVPDLPALGGPGDIAPGWDLRRGWFQRGWFQQIGYCRLSVSQQCCFP